MHKNNFITQIKDIFNKLSVKTELFYTLFVTIIYLIIGGINYLAWGSPLINSGFTWFWSGLIMVIFSTYYIEPYFTAPTNVFANAVALFMLIISLGPQEVGGITLWRISLCILALLIILSLFSKLLYDKERGNNYTVNKITEIIKEFLATVGSGKVLYSIVFLYFLILNIYQEAGAFKSWYLLSIFLLFAFVLAISPKEIKSLLAKLSKNIKNKNYQIGEVFAIQSENVFLVKIFNDTIIKNFTPVQFKHKLIANGRAIVYDGFIFDIYYLDNQRWAKVIKISESSTNNNTNNAIEDDFVYIVNDTNEADIITDKINKFVGIVTENSTLKKISFEYSQEEPTLEVDDLLEVYVRGKKVFYQVIGARTDLENLEKHNQTGKLTVEAIQLGQWDKVTKSFKSVGWLPKINTPVYLANTQKEYEEIADGTSIEFDELKIGIVPGTDPALPISLNWKNAIFHHIAILGVTGAGKTVLAKKLIERMSKKIKVICVDFTGEYKEDLKKLSPKLLVDPAGVKKTEEIFAKKENELRSRTVDKTKILDLKNKAQKQLHGYVESFMEGDNNLGIFELPELSNTSFILEFTQLFLEVVFDYAKDNPGNQISIVLEEAHTIVPETSFLGEPGDYGSSKYLVNKMGQIALQGRKYGVGLLVIGQRSANISKTVLTQCNTIIAFKAFDDTSYGFLANYFGQNTVRAVPNLKPYHAIVYGKGFASDSPVIVNTYDEDEARKDNLSSKDNNEQNR